MLEGLKRLFTRSSAGTRGWDELVVWAEPKQYVFRPLRDEHGFIVEGHLGTLPWRMEWGASQRPYVTGPELRIRAEVGLGTDVQVMVLDRALQASMESAVFEQFVEGVQTRIDNQTPPEMRWLVMYPKLGGAELGALREHFAAVAAHKPWLLQWLEGPLAAALLAAPRTAGQPIALMVARGRLTLRVGLAEPAPASLDAWLRVFHTALREARRVGEQGAGAGAASTQPSLWSATGTAGEPPGPA